MPVHNKVGSMSHQRNRGLLYAFCLAVGLFLLGGCASKVGGERVMLDSADPVFVDELLANTATPKRRIFGWLRQPEPGSSGPAPALVILHTSFGQGVHDRQYADLFSSLGFAVLAVDSFQPRGVSTTTQEQTLVTEFSMVADAYAALAYLSARPGIDNSRIGVIGFSKGGIAALYASLESVRNALTRKGESFAAHIAYYPWCGLRFLTPRTTGAPILIQAGGADEVTPPYLCTELLQQFRTVNPMQQADMIVHEGARHGFDHPVLENIAWSPTGGVTPASCLIREVRPNEYIEESTGRFVHSKNLKSIIWGCSGSIGVVGGDKEAGAQALKETVSFLQRNLL